MNDAHKRKIENEVIAVNRMIQNVQTELGGISYEKAEELVKLAILAEIVEGLASIDGGIDALV